MFLCLPSPPRLGALWGQEHSLLLLAQQRVKDEEGTDKVGSPAVPGELLTPCSGDPHVLSVGKEQGHQWLTVATENIRDTNL